MNENSSDQTQQSGRASLHPPKPIETAFGLWIDVAALIVLDILVLLVLELIGLYRSYQTGYYTEFIIADLLEFSVPIMMIILAAKMRAGRNWARITLTVIGAGLTLLFLVRAVLMLTEMTGPVGLYLIFRLLIIVGQLALIGGGIALMFRPRVATYFT